MIDAEQLDDGSLIEADVVIVGGGIVGLALARQSATLATRSPYSNPVGKGRMHANRRCTRAR